MEIELISINSNFSLGFHVSNNLSKASIITWLQRAIGRNPDVRITVAWGTQSELSNDAQLRADLQEVAKTKKQTIQTMPIQNQKHAFANDIYLHAAIIREALV